jgi:hypothetical protein
LYDDDERFLRTFEMRMRIVFAALAAAAAIGSAFADS